MPRTIAELYEQNPDLSGYDPADVFQVYYDSQPDLQQFAPEEVAHVMGVPEFRQQWASALSTGDVPQDAPAWTPGMRLPGETPQFAKSSVPLPNAPDETPGPKPTFWENLAHVPGDLYQGLGRGSAQLGRSAGATVQYLGSRLGIDTITEAGDWLASTYEDELKHWERPKELQGNLTDDWSKLWNPRWLAQGVGEIAPSLAASVLPASGAYHGIKALQIGRNVLPMTAAAAERIAQLGSALVGGLAGGTLEGAGTYRDELQQGTPEAHAARAGEMQAAFSTGLNALSLGRILKPGGWAKHALAAGTEGVTEGAEEVTDQLSRDVARYLYTGEVDGGLDGLIGRLGAAAEQGVNVVPIAAITGGGASVLAGGAPEADEAPRPRFPGFADNGRTARMAENIDNVGTIETAGDISALQRSARFSTEAQKRRRFEAQTQAWEDAYQRQQLEKAAPFDDLSGQDFGPRPEDFGGEPGVSFGGTNSIIARKDGSPFTEKGARLRQAVLAQAGKRFDVLPVGEGGFVLRAVDESPVQPSAVRAEGFVDISPDILAGPPPMSRFPENMDVVQEPQTQVEDARGAMDQVAAIRAQATTPVQTLPPGLAYAGDMPPSVPTSAPPGGQPQNSMDTEPAGFLEGMGLGETARVLPSVEGVLPGEQHTTRRAPKVDYSEFSDERLRIEERRYNSVQNEGHDGHNPYGEELQRRYVQRARGLEPEVTAPQARDELALWEKEKKNTFWREWTEEETKKRQGEWNKRVTSGEFTDKNGSVDAKKMSAAQKRQGWTLPQLNRAVARHKRNAFLRGLLQPPPDVNAEARRPAIGQDEMINGIRRSDLGVRMREGKFVEVVEHVMEGMARHGVAQVEDAAINELMQEFSQARQRGDTASQLALAAAEKPLKAALQGKSREEVLGLARDAEAALQADGAQAPEVVERFVNEDDGMEAIVHKSRNQPAPEPEPNPAPRPRPEFLVDLEFKGKAHHAKKKIDLYVVDKKRPVPSDVYDKLKRKAKQLGGYWSSYRGRGAIPGFQFESMEAAREFIDAFAEPRKEGLDTQERQVIFRAVLEHFKVGGAFRTITDARGFAGGAIDRKINPGTIDAKDLDEVIEKAVVAHARDIVRNMRAFGATRDEVYDALVHLYQEQQPTLGVRTSTSVANQAYSTPAPLAFLASELANINEGDFVYEPTAGNGMLLVGADPKTTFANELNKDRAANLKDMGFSVTTEDATAYVPGRKVDAVIMNPPFGRVREDSQNKTWEIHSKYTTSEVDHAIVFKGLEAMKNDGRAVLIIGGKMGEGEARANKYQSREQRSFYATLFGRYNVVDHFTVNGKLYSRQGASFPVDVIVIDGRGESDRTFPAASPPRIYNSFEELKEAFNGPQEIGSALPGDQRPAGGGSQDNTGLPAKGKDNGSDGTGVLGVSEPQGAENARPDSRPGGRGSGDKPDSGIQVAGGPGQVDAGEQEASGQDSGRGEPRTEKPSGNDGQGANGAASTQGVSSGRGFGRQRGGVGRDDSRSDVEGEKKTDFQVAYKPASGMVPFGVLVPKNMARATEKALDAVRETHGDLDNFVADALGYDREGLRTAFAAEQVDALALAIHNIDKSSGFIIGDQTGIGKGRVNAGIIRYARRKGLIPIFVTYKPKLYGDMLGDMHDIGESLDNIFITNDRGVDSVFERSDGKGKTPKHSKQKKLEIMDAIAEGRSSFDAVFTTYSQVQSLGADKPNPRVHFMSRVARRAVFILDESHNAGGSGDTRIKTNSPPRSKTIRNLLRASPHGVFYSSATYAKRPQVMDLYFKTDMAKAVPDVSQLAEAIGKGGVPMQQVVASMLAETGQYVRRERSFDGIEFNTINVPASEETANGSAEIFQSIMVFDEYKKKAVKKISERVKGVGDAAGSDTATGSAGATSVNFTSLMHNIIGQMILGLKVQATADLAIKELKAGNKPVIALMNTLESVLKRYVEENNIAQNDVVDIKFNDVTDRYLKRSREVTITNAFGERTRRPLTDEELGPNGVAAYRRAKKLIRDIDLSAIPMSPIDYIRQKIENAGYRTSELTGRKTGLDYSDENAPKYVGRKSENQDTIVNDFNSGKADALVLNVSGSTGLSIHASEKFKDQRPRRMLIIQADPNIDTFMQTLGRIHRTGQVALPGYSLINADIPAEKRPASVLSKKLASLNANTTADSDSALSAGTDSIDFMDELGDRIATSIMGEDPELHAALGYPLKKINPDNPQTDAAKIVTGRIPALPVAEQKRFYELFESEYLEELANMERAGMSQKRANTLPLDAIQLEEYPLTSAGEGDSPFSSESKILYADVKKIGKPYSKKEVLQHLAEAVGAEGETDTHTLQRMGQETAQNHLRELNKEFQEYTTALAGAFMSEAAEERAVERAENAMESTSRLIKKLTPGSIVVMDHPAGANYTGVVLSVEPKGSTKNPAAASRWKIRVATTDATRLYSGSLSNLSVSGKSTSGFTVSVLGYDLDKYLDNFERGQRDVRERRYIAVGNILAAYSALEEGQIVNFTNRSGTTQPGIILPEKFNIKQFMSNQPVTMPSSDSIMSFLRAVPDGIVQSFDEVVQIKNISRHGLSIVVPRARGAGGVYYMDPELMRVAGGEFVSHGGNAMVRPFNPHEFEPIFGYFKDNGIGFKVTAYKDIAQSIVDETGDAPLYLRTSRPDGRPFKPMSVRDVKAVADQITKRWGRAPSIKVVQHETMLPKEVYDDIIRRGGLDEVRGVYHNGRVYLVANNMGTARDVHKSVAHEVLRHHGLREVFGSGFNDFLRAAGKNVTIDKVADVLAEKYRLNRAKANENLAAIEEAIVHLGDRGWKSNIIDRVVTAARKFLRRMGYDLKLTNAEIKTALSQASRLVRRGRQYARLETADAVENLGAFRFSRAWHGSPHRFDKFSTEAIGTGEGAQAFGWGMYFTGTEALAEWYREKLSKDIERIDLDGDVFEKTNDGWIYTDDSEESYGPEPYDSGLALALDLFDYYRNQDRAVSALTRAMEDDVSDGEALLSEINWEGPLESAKEALVLLTQGEVKEAVAGQTYEVEIPGDEDLLDWDRPLSEQPEGVREKLSRVLEVTREDILAILEQEGENNPYDPVAVSTLAAIERGDPVTGEELYEAISANVGARATSEYFLSLGIPGHRYLDGTSRGKGEGSYNYVIYHDDDVSITRTYYSRPLTPEQQAFMDKIGAEKRPVVQRVKDWFAYFRARGWDEVIQGMFDMFHSTKRLGSDIYQTIRLSHSNDNLLHEMLLTGVPTYDASGVATIDSNGIGLLDIFSPLGDDLDLFLANRVAIRAQKLKKEGRENLFSDEDINAGLALRPKDKAQARLWDETWKEYVAYRRKVLDFGVQSGVIDAQARTLWEDYEHIPFYRLGGEPGKETDKTKGPRNKRGLVDQSSGIRTLRGGKSNIGDPLANIIMNLTHIVDAGVKNRAAAMAMDKAMAMGMASKAEVQFEHRKARADKLATQVRKIFGDKHAVQSMTKEQREKMCDLFLPTPPIGADVVSVMKKGKRVYYHVDDDMLLRSLANINDQFLNFFPLRQMRSLKRILTTGITIDPAFRVANLLRDTLAVWVISGGKFKPFIDSFKGTMDLYRKNPETMRTAAAGGLFHGSGFSYGADPGAKAKSVRDAMAMKLKGKPFRVLDTPQKIASFLRQAWDFWENVGSIAENASRAALARQRLAAGGSLRDAAFEARDIMDFSLRGDWKAFQFLAQVVPFFNARLQGLYKLGRGATENPKTFAARGAMLAVAAVLLYLYNREDDRFKELEEWDRDNYFHFWLGDTHFALPKPFEVGVLFGTMPERLTEFFLEGDEKVLGERLIFALENTLSMNPIPQAIKPAIEQWANKDFFTQRPIVGRRLEGLQPGEQTYAWTSPTAKAVGKAVNVSPRRLEHLVRGYFGTLGTYVLGASDVVAQRLMGYPNPPSKGVADYRVVRRFVRSSDPAAHTKFGTRMYEISRELDELVATINHYRKLGDFDRAREMVRAERDKLRFRKYVSSTRSAVRNLDRRIERIWADRNMTPEEKEKRINELNERKNAIMQRAYEKVYPEFR